MNWPLNICYCLSLFHLAFGNQAKHRNERNSLLLLLIVGHLTIKAIDGVTKLQDFLTKVQSTVIH